MRSKVIIFWKDSIDSSWKTWFRIQTSINFYITPNIFRSIRVSAEVIFIEKWIIINIFSAFLHFCPWLTLVSINGSCLCSCVIFSPNTSQKFWVVFSLVVIVPVVFIECYFIRSVGLLPRWQDAASSFIWLLQKVKRLAVKLFFFETFFLTFRHWEIFNCFISLT